MFNLKLSCRRTELLKLEFLDKKSKKLKIELIKCLKRLSQSKKTQQIL